MRDLGPTTLRNWITRALPKLWNTEERRLRNRLHEVETELQWIIRLEVQDAYR